MASPLILSPMSDTARSYQPDSPADISGLDALFDVEVEPSSAKVSQVSPTEGVPVDYAAKVLGLSVKTVKDRLRKGTLNGRKVKDKFGEKWLVVLGSDYQEVPESIEIVPESSPSQVGVVGAPVDLKPFFDLLERKDRELQAATFRNGFLENQIADYTNQLKLLPDLQAQAKDATDLRAQLEHKQQELLDLRAQVDRFEQSWWVRFSRWFFQSR